MEVSHADYYKSVPERTEETHGEIISCAIDKEKIKAHVDVLDIVKNFEAATGVKIPYSIKPRRAGDVASCYSDATKAKRELGWEAEYGILEMCRDSWNWQKKKFLSFETGRNSLPVKQGQLWI